MPCNCRCAIYAITLMDKRKHNHDRVQHTHVHMQSNCNYGRIKGIAINYYDSFSQHINRVILQNNCSLTFNIRQIKRQRYHACQNHGFHCIFKMLCFEYTIYQLKYEYIKQRCEQTFRVTQVTWLFRLWLFAIKIIYLLFIIFGSYQGIALNMQTICAWLVVSCFAMFWYRLNVILSYKMNYLALEKSSDCVNNIA